MGRVAKKIKQCREVKGHERDPYYKENEIMVHELWKSINLLRVGKIGKYVWLDK